MWDYSNEIEQILKLKEDLIASLGEQIKSLKNEKSNMQPDLPKDDLLSLHFKIRNLSLELKDQKIINSDFEMKINK